MPPAHLFAVALTEKDLLQAGKVLGQGQSVGPMLMGVAKPAHILTPSVTTRGIVNMSALAVVDAQMYKQSAGV